MSLLSPISMVTVPPISPSACRLRTKTGTDDGAVNVIYGSAAGLNAAGNQFWAQDTPGIIGTREAGDRLDPSLAVANFGNRLPR